MSPKFIAEPPKPIKWGGLAQHFWRLVHRFFWIVWWSICPFKDRPEEIDSLPEPKTKIDEKHVTLAQAIFDQTSSRRSQLEQKAQWTFALMLFLVPALVSLFVFAVSKMPSSHATLRAFAIGPLILSALLLFVGFVAAVRAISVKGHETLFIKSLVDDAGEFKKYKEADHARGLLYCAAMNEGTNDHIAQFVKGAHVMTAVAITALVLAAVPTCYVLTGLGSSPTEMKMVRLVEVTPPDANTVRDDLARLNAEIRTLLSNSRAESNDLKRLQGRVSDLDAKLKRMQKAISTLPSKK